MPVADGTPSPSTAAALSGVAISDDWFVMWPDLAHAMEAQLARELLPDHVLAGRHLVGALKSNDSDDVVFYERDAAGNVLAWWMVHLSWATSVDARWPSTARLDPPAAGQVWP